MAMPDSQRLPPLPEAEFKEFEPRLNYGWFQLKLYLIIQDLSRRSIETGFGEIWDAA